MDGSVCNRFNSAVRLMYYGFEKSKVKSKKSKDALRLKDFLLFTFDFLLLPQLKLKVSPVHIPSHTEVNHSGI